MFSSTQGAAASATPKRSGTARRATLAPAKTAAATAARSAPELMRSGAWPFACAKSPAATGNAMAQNASSVRTYAIVPETPYFLTSSYLRRPRVFDDVAAER